MQDISIETFLRNLEKFLQLIFNLICRVYETLLNAEKLLEYNLNTRIFHNYSAL